MSDYIVIIDTWASMKMTDAIDSVAHHVFPFVGQCFVDVVTGFLVSPASYLNDLLF